MQTPKTTCKKPKLALAPFTPKQQYITPKEAAIIMRITPASLANMRARGEGPSYIRRSRFILYTEHDVIDFLESGRVQTRV